VPTLLVAVAVVQVRSAVMVLHFKAVMVVLV
jgi:hypothetical protein